MGCFGKKRKKPDVVDPVEAKPLLKDDDDEESEDVSESEDESDESSSDDEQQQPSKPADVLGEVDELTEKQATAALAHLLHRDLSRGWRTWNEYLKGRGLLTRGFQYMRNRQLGSSWTSWQDAVVSFAAWAHALRHMTNRELTKGFGSWRSHVEAQLDEATRSRAVVQRMRNGGLARGLFHWSTTVAALRDQIDAMRASLGHLKNRQLSGAWRGWHEFATAHAEAIGLLEASAGALRNRELRRGWVGWCDCHQSEGPQLAALGAAVHHLKQRDRLRGWRAWTERTAELQLLGKSMSHMRNRQLAAGLGAWRDARAFAAKMDHAIGVLRLRTVGKLWREWSEMVAAASVMDTALRRLRNRGLCNALGAWTSWLAENATALSQLRAAFGAMSHRACNRAWLVWLDNLASDAQEEKAKCVRRLLHGQLARGLGAWVALVDERAEALQALRRGASALVNKQLAAAMMSWREASDLLGTHKRRKERKRQKKLAVKYFKQHSVVRAFHSWASEASNLALLNRAVRQLRNQALARVYGSWVEMAVERASYMRKLRLGAGRMLNRRLAAALGAWRSACPYQKKGGAVGGALRNVFGSGAAPMLGWFGYEETSEEKMARALKRLVQKDKLRGWDAWAELRQERMAMRKSAGKLLHAQSAKAMDAWKELVRSRREHLEAVRNAARGMLNHQVHKGMGKWLAIAQGKWALEERGGKAMRIMLQRDLSRGWGAWRSLVDARAATLEGLRSGVGKMLNRRLASALGSWRHYLYGKDEVKKSDAELGKRAAAYLVQSSMDGPRGAWLTWQGQYAERFKARRAYEYALAHPCEPDKEPRRPQPVYKPGRELFDRAPMLDVRDAAGRKMYEWKPRARPQKMPRRPVETPEDLARRLEETGLAKNKKHVKAVHVARRRWP